MYENGQGTSKNRVEAYKWYLIAAASGIGKAFDNRDRLAGQMSKAQRREGQQRARDWLAGTSSLNENRGS
jgi:TPR repeat protein